MSFGIRLYPAASRQRFCPSRPPNELLSKLSSHPSGVRLALNEQPRVSLALHPGLASCTPEACEDGSPGCASDSEPPRVGRPYHPL